MNSSYIVTLITTGFTVAFLHAAIPTHWLPFVMIGRGRGWSRRQTLAAVALAGGGHILTTTALGIGLAWFGFELSDRFGEMFHWAVAALLISLGGWLAFRAPHGTSCKHCQGHPEKLLPETTDYAALWALFLTLTLSPCELFLPVYLTAVPYGWPGILWLSAVLAVATLAGMLIFTWLTLYSVQSLRWRWLQKPHPRLIGILLTGLGLGVVLFDF